ncbi:class I SAM-dependent methyltransferase [Halobacillus litoralis]|uniref:class I SAM-dependent methyltransferase n=1 Tax=Halobacillus litoralis TaxID=45668 RepID=UPI0024933490|nr:class I SAM-dependent methyltransferase [Halobacillus litoralis]
MQYRESGMPDMELWETFFDPVSFLKTLELNPHTNNYLDVGSGFGTFLIPASKIISGSAIGIDVNQEYLDICSKRIGEENLQNIYLIHGDSSNEKTLETVTQYVSEVDYISLFNMLHCEEPLELLNRTAQLLNPKGKLGVIHWKSNKTPRGPTMAIRPSPRKVRGWGEQAGLTFLKTSDLSPYHFGVLFEK